MGIFRHLRTVSDADKGSDLQLAGAYPPASGGGSASVYLLAERWKGNFPDLDSGCGLYSDLWNSRYEHVPVYLFYGDRRLQCGTATVLQYIGPVLILIYLSLRNRKPPRPVELLAIILAVAGTFLLATHGRPGSMVLSKTALFWGLLSAVALAVYTVQPGRLLNEYGSAVVTAWGMLIGGIMLCCIFHPWTIPVEADSQVVLGMAVIILVGTVIAFSCYMEGIRCVGAKKGSLYASVEPVSATVFSVIWMHVSFGLMDLIGFACIISTIFLLALDKKE